MKVYNRTCFHFCKMNEKKHNNENIILLPNYTSQQQNRVFITYMGESKKQKNGNTILFCKYPNLQQNRNSIVQLGVKKIKMKT